MSRLNYNKWDNLQLSDDSDIEVHPNVDKRSMIRWKQRDIHEKREERKLKLKQFETEVPMNASLIARMDSLISSTKADGAQFIANEVQRLKAALPYSYELKKFEQGEQPSEDHMIVSLLSQVINEATKKEQAAGKGEEGRDARLVAELEWHKKRLLDRQEEIKKETAEIEAEQKKWITSDDIRTGWDSKTIVSNAPTAQPVAPPPTASSSKPKSTKTETVVETLNSPAVQAAAQAEDSGDSSDDADVAPLSAYALAFSKIAPLDWNSVKQAISSDPSLLTEETGDALMVEAFSQAMKGTKAGEKRARECIEKALIGQYCRSLGRDGTALFFQRMTGANHAVLKIFLDDVLKTSERIIDRAKVVAAERAAKAGDQEGVEQIQLVASSPDTTITFEVPDGPPPEHLEITGEGSEELDPVLVREFLQKRWDIFESFPKNLKAALAEKNLEKVNKVLGRMSVEDAEQVVEQLQEAGILSFEQPGVIDQTGRSGEPSIDIPGARPAGGEEASSAPRVEGLNLEDDLD
ncbi:hsp90 co-chaperone Cdc37 [Rhodotorula kratochvilovae]